MPSTDRKTHSVKDTATVPPEGGAEGASGSPAPPAGDGSRAGAETPPAGSDASPGAETATDAVRLSSVDAPPVAPITGAKVAGVPDEPEVAVDPGTLPHDDASLPWFDVEIPRSLTKPMRVQARHESEALARYMAAVGIHSHLTPANVAAVPVAVA
jgi:hypothetical protein